MIIPPSDIQKIPDSTTENGSSSSSSTLPHEELEPPPPAYEPTSPHHHVSLSPVSSSETASEPPQHDSRGVKKTKRLNNYRLATFGLCICFSIAQFVTSIQFETRWSGHRIWTMITIITAGLALAILPMLLWVSRRFSRNFISSAAMEMFLVAILSILWLVTASLSTSDLAAREEYYWIFFSFGEATVICNLLIALVALSFINWIFLMVYGFLIFVLCLLSTERGNNVWKSPITSGAVFLPRSSGKERDVSQSHYYPPLPPQPPIPTTA